MKTATSQHLHALILCLFLLAFTTTTTLGQGGLVLDSEGKPVINGDEYYILPVMRGRGGGLELAKTGSERCPLTVVQARSELSHGLPARLSSPALILTLTTSLPMQIAFTPPEESTCLPSPSSWNVERESKIGQSVVKIARDDQQVGFGSFGIRRVDDGDYKLVYCASSSDADCKDLGISIDDENNRLLVVKDGDPLIVQFLKAHRYHDSAKPKMSIV